MKLSIARVGDKPEPENGGYLEDSFGLYADKFNCMYVILSLSPKSGKLEKRFFGGDESMAPEYALK